MANPNGNFTIEVSKTGNSCAAGERLGAKTLKRVKSLSSPARGRA